mgnify:CR=1 FL=1|jgi:transposase-like protein
MTWDTCVKDYLQLIKGGCPEELRPTWCRRCQSEAKFHKHGEYKRTIITIGEPLEITVFRFKCSSCNMTCSILPPFLRRNHIAALDVQEQVTLRHIQGISLRIISEQLPAQLAFSEKTLWRWKKYWQKRLDKLRSTFWPIVLARCPHLLFPRGGSSVPSSSWAWFFWVWNKTRGQWTDRPAGALQWLVLLSQPVAVTAGG